ncbi:hypothetical protein BD410DRAFT_310888 [Rickenella mellea]|uniref:DUF7587 domain-containing protein n=1 Tax=Rickenella mellea TaxID=50990 RepID=A0A4Y7Q286_9AGAM|nr:hypothetical protein BD410DRAFT_310888 [Rickenella mellea]
MSDPSSSSAATFTPPNTLLAFGFRAGANNSPIENLESITTEHSLIFRVHHVKSHVRFVEGRGFMAGRYQEGQSAVEARADYDVIAQDHSQHSNAVYRHLLNKGNTPFVSATFSLAWIVSRSSQLWKRGDRDVLIAVIDAKQVSATSFFALQHIHDSREKNAQGARYWANAAQEVLVPVCIPNSAILACVPWEELARNIHSFPRWFKTVDGEIDGHKKYVTSREFTRKARNRFTVQSITPDQAISDAVQFAFAMLDPWMKKHSVLSTDSLTSTNSLPRVFHLVLGMANDVVRWPGLEYDRGYCFAQSWDWAVIQDKVFSTVLTELSSRIQGERPVSHSSERVNSTGAREEIIDLINDLEMSHIC